MIRRLRRLWLCWRYGLCRFHGTLRPTGGYGEGRWGRCETCAAENREKEMYGRNHMARERVAARERLDRDWALPRKEFGGGND